MHKPILIAVGLVCVGLAVLGIFLPILPTTPLLLVAVACFARSSEKLHNWILSNNTFGPIIKEWHETKSIPRRAKVYAIIMIIIAGGVSVVLLDNTILKVVLILFLLIPFTIVLKIKSTETIKGQS